MHTNLLSPRWADLDPAELRFTLFERIGKPGQYEGEETKPNAFYMPLARQGCQIKLMFSGGKEIASIEPGPAFDANRWAQVVRDIETGAARVGRDVSFSSFRVSGSWRGKRSGLQILPAPEDAPRAPVEMAEHPFVLEFPIKASDHWQITNFRRRREHHILTLLLNVLLVGRTSFAPSRSRHLWATAPDKEFSPGGAKWAQEFYFADIGEIVRDELAPPAAELLEEVDPDTYYTKVGHDGRGLRVPADLDDSICHYLELSKADKQKFGRAAFWMDMASHQWTLSLSASFASLCIACEALGERTAASTRRFKDFIERYAPSASLQVRREQMWGALDFGAVTPGRISR